MYCAYCGAEVNEHAAFCVKCGCLIEKCPTIVNDPVATQHPIPAEYDPDHSVKIVIKVFLILSCVAMGWMLIPLAWCVPMTVSICNSLNHNIPISTGTKVCTLIFVNLIAGICLLCMNDRRQQY